MVKTTTITNTSIQISAEDVRKVLAERFASDREVSITFLDDGGDPYYIEYVTLSFSVEEETE